MISIQEFAPQRLEMTLTGRIDEADVATLENALECYLEDEGSVNAVLDFSGLHRATTRGLTKDAAFQARVLAQTDKFGRLAVVTKASTLGTIVSSFDAIMPPGEFGKFAPDHLDEARAFVT